MRYLLDTNILIYHLGGDDTATDFIRRNLKHSSISFITYIEVLSYKFSLEDEIRVRSFLDAFNLIGINKEIMESSVRIRRLRKIKIPDCIIAATALSANLQLVTKNSSDFNVDGVSVMNPYADI